MRLFCLTIQNYLINLQQEKEDQRFVHDAQVGSTSYRLDHFNEG